MGNEHVTHDMEIEKCVLVGVIDAGKSEETALEHLEELKFLATTAGAETVKQFQQSIPYPNPKLMLVQEN